MTEKPELRRHSLAAQASKTEALLESTQAKDAMAAMREDIVSQMEVLKLDGSPSSTDAAVELVRKLQTLLSFKRELVRPIARQRAEEAKQPRQPS